LAIWDARLKDAAWRNKETWQPIAKIRGVKEDVMDQAATAVDSETEEDAEPKPELEGSSR